MLNWAKFALAVLVIFTSVVACEKNDLKEVDPTNIKTSTETSSDVIEGKYIVTFKESYLQPSIKKNENNPIRDRDAKKNFSDKERIATEVSIQEFTNSIQLTEDKISHIYTASVTGFAAELTETQVFQLRSNSNIQSVEEDRVVMLELPLMEKEEDKVKDARYQFTPCGITNAGGSADGSTKGTWIWIVDTGIDLAHEDLNVQTSSTYKFDISGGNSDDCNGHGTHVSGTAAAKNNNIGVVGVSAGAKVVPVKVFYGCSGSTSTSNIIAGLNHIANYDIPGDVVNMSVGGYYGSACSSYTSYITSINNLANAGTRISIAAGNDASNAALYQPACVNRSNVYTIASMTCNGGWSSFSNYGIPPIDWIATGSYVYSTYKNGSYATISGTSMAAPHVAGILHQRNAAPRYCGYVYRNGSYYLKACR